MSHPRAWSLRVTSVSFMSEPLIRNPRLGRTSAIPLIPRPPIPTKWMFLIFPFRYINRLKVKSSKFKVHRLLFIVHCSSSSTCLAHQRIAMLHNLFGCPRTPDPPDCFFHPLPFLRMMVKV